MIGWSRLWVQVSQVCLRVPLVLPPPSLQQQQHNLLARCTLVSQPKRLGCFLGDKQALLSHWDVAKTDAGLEWCADNQSTGFAAFSAATQYLSKAQLQALCVAWSGLAASDATTLVGFATGNRQSLLDWLHRLTSTTVLVDDKNYKKNEDYWSNGLMQRQSPSFLPSPAPAVCMPHQGTIPIPINARNLSPLACHYRAAIKPHL